MRRDRLKMVLAGVAAGAALVGLVLVWPSSPGNRQVASAESKSAKDNMYLLAQLVCGEARGEPYEGKVGVAAVILNRTQDKRFPRSVAGVVYQTSAFESVSNGQIYAGITGDCLKAARAALAGWDPSHGAVFFFNPAKTSSGFIWSRQQVRQIGKHIFAR